MNTNNSNDYGSSVGFHLPVTGKRVNSLQDMTASSGQRTRRLWNKRNRQIIALIILVLAMGMIFSSASAASLEALNHDGNNRLPAKIGKQINIIEVTTIADLIHPHDGLCSLREAIISANTNPVGLAVAGECAHGSPTITDRIIVESGFTYQLANFDNPLPDDATANDLDIVDNPAAVDLQIMPDGEGMTIIRGTAPEFAVTVGVDGFNKDRVFDIEDATVELYRLDIRHGVAMSSKSGGGILNDGGDVTLVDSRLTENRSSNGGAIANHNGTVSLIRTEVTVNGNHFQDGLSDELYIYGGGILNSGEAAHLFLEESVISFNRIDFDNAAQPIGRTGSGIYNYLGTVTFVPGNEATEIIHNTTYDGGAIHNEGGIIEGSNFSVFGNNVVSPSNFINGSGIANVVGYSGNLPGEINLSDGFVGFQSTLTGIFNQGSVTLSDMNLGVNGKGAIINQGGDVTLTGVSLQVNDGPGLESNGGVVIIDQSRIWDNEVVGQNGGGIRLMSGAAATITRSSITGNSAQAAGGIYLFDSSLTMANSTVSSNETTLGVGGGIMVQGSAVGETIEFINVTVHNNSTQAGVGSAFFLLSGTIVPETVNSIWSAPVGETACGGNTGSNPLSSNGNNLSSDDTCLSLGNPTDQTNTDPHLAPLAEINGATVHELLKSSPARDQADQLVCAAAPVKNQDQRGFPRGSSCDIGAFELDSSD